MGDDLVVRNLQKDDYNFIAKWWKWWRWKVIPKEMLPEYCKKLGYDNMFSIGRNKHLIDTHKKLGWAVDNKSSYEIIKKLR